MAGRNGLFRCVGFCGVGAGRRAYGLGTRCREGRAPTFLAAGGGAFPATHSSAAGASRSACVSSATTRLLTPPSPSATTANPLAGSKLPSATLPNCRGAVELPCVEPTWLGLGLRLGLGLGSVVRVRVRVGVRVSVEPPWTTARPASRRHGSCRRKNRRPTVETPYRRAGCGC